MQDRHASLGLLLYEVARQMRLRFGQRIRKTGLARSQWQLLVYLAKNEGTHQAGLAELLEIEPITLGRTIDKLEKLAIVERRQHPTDRRTKLIYVTESARPLLARLESEAEAVRQEALEGVSDDDRDKLDDILTMMKTNLTELRRAVRDGRKS
jgi:DNA-binding MarR family transcriptional regulator